MQRVIHHYEWVCRSSYLNKSSEIQISWHAEIRTVVDEFTDICQVVGLW